MDSKSLPGGDLNLEKMSNKEVKIKRIALHIYGRLDLDRSLCRKFGCYLLLVHNNQWRGKACLTLSLI